MSTSLEKLCLKWNDFEQNISSAFGLLRQDKDFVDVTLVSEDGQQVDLHKVVLASSSPFFMQLLNRNKQSQHPLIFMRGSNFEELSAIVDFLYYGEASVFQEHLDGFLALAGELKLKGLSGNCVDDAVAPAEFQPEGNKKRQKDSKTKSKKKKDKNHLVEANDSFEDPVIQSPKYETTVDVQDQVKIVGDLQGQADDSFTDPTIESPKFEITVDAQECQVKVVGNLQGMNQEIRSMMDKSEVNSDSTGRPASICKVCGKEGQKANIWNHIEAKHITSDVSYKCDLCGKSSKTRNGLFLHKSKNHRE